jgi:hypothetical protein
MYGLLVATALSGGIGTAKAACYFGSCTNGGPSTAAPAAPGAGDESGPTGPVWHTVATYGSWSVRTNGHQVALMKEMDGNAHVALVKDGESVAFVLEDPKWGLEEGKRFDGRIVINGEGFRGNAVALSPTMVAFPNMSEAALHAFFRGGSAEVAVAGSTWRMSLDGADEALHKAAER